MTAFADITSAILAALNTAPAVSEHIFRARDRAMAEEWANAVNVQVDSALANDGVIAGAPIDWETKVSIECYAKSSTTSGDLAVDALLESVFARMASDSTLGGVVQDIRLLAIKAEYDSQAQKTGWIGMTYQALHRTSNSTLE